MDLNLRLKEEKVRWTTLVIILGAAFLATGFWWDSKKEEKTGETPSAPKSQEPVSASASPKTVAPGKKEREVKITPLRPSAIRAQKEDFEVSKGDREEVEKIQNELKEVVTRTQELQAQAKTERSEISEIMERARIHEQILRNMSIPKPIVVSQRINVDEVLRREKLRLIAEEASRVQRQLRAVEAARAAERTMQIEKQMRLIQAAPSAETSESGKSEETETSPPAQTKRT